MKKYWDFLYKQITASVLILLLLCCTETVKSNESLTIVCFGNSTTAPRKNIEKVYPVRLGESLANIGIPAKMINAGIGGSHTGSVKDNNFHKIQHAMDRFQTAVLNQRPQWVIIAFGINDAWQDKGQDSSSRISLGKYIQNIEYFITEIEKTGAKTILLTPNPIGKKYEPWRKNKLKEYTDATIEIAQKGKTLLVDVWKIFEEHTQNSPNGVDDLLLDGMHPSDKGHILIADALTKIIGETDIPPVNQPSGKLTKDSLWIESHATELPNLKMGPFIHLQNGAILTVDTTNSYISDDNGKTWKAYAIFGEPDKFLIREERALILTKKGTVILAFVNDKEKANWNWQNDIHDAPNAILPTYTVISKDGGKTWGNLQKLHNEWTGAVRDIIETEDGHIVFTSMMMRHNPGHHTVLTYVSDNEGKNWQRSNVIDLGGTGHHSGVTESTLIQLKDKRLWMLMRTNWGKFWETYSTDNGIHWNEPKATAIDASSAPGMLKRLQSGRLILIWNRYYPEGKNSYPLKGGDMQWSEVPVSNHREELSVMFSENEGKNWTQPVVLARTTRKDTQISYPYVFENTPGELFITTMYGGLRIALREKDFVRK